MTTESTPTPPKSGPMISGDHDIKIQTGEGMEVAPEPSDDETTGEVEETTQNNETEAPETTEEAPAEPEVEEGGDVKQSSSKVINQLGEDRKDFAEGLIELARKDDASRKYVQELVQSDPKKEAYFKSKFGDDYDALFKEPVPEPVAEVDVDKIREEERLRAKVEILEEQDRKRKTEAVITYAEKLGFDTEEATKLEDFARVLEDRMPFEDALPKAALLVNQDKTDVKASPPVSTGGNEPAPKSTKVQPTEELAAYGRRTGRSAEQVAESLQRVEERLSSDGRTMSLPLG